MKFNCLKLTDLVVVPSIMPPTYFPGSHFPCPQRRHYLRHRYDFHLHPRARAQEPPRTRSGRDHAEQRGANSRNLQHGRGRAPLPATDTSYVKLS